MKKKRDAVKVIFTVYNYIKKMVYSLVKKINNIPSYGLLFHSLSYNKFFQFPMTNFEVYFLQIDILANNFLKTFEILKLLKNKINKKIFLLLFNNMEISDSKTKKIYCKLKIFIKKQYDVKTILLYDFCAKKYNLLDKLIIKFHLKQLLKFFNISSTDTNPSVVLLKKLSFNDSPTNNLNRHLIYQGLSIINSNHKILKINNYYLNIYENYPPYLNHKFFHKKIKIILKIMFNINILYKILECHKCKCELYYRSFLNSILFEWKNSGIILGYYLKNKYYKHHLLEIQASRFSLFKLNPFDWVHYFDNTMRIIIPLIPLIRTIKNSKLVVTSKNSLLNKFYSYYYSFEILKNKYIYWYILYRNNEIKTSGISIIRKTFSNFPKIYCLVINCNLKFPFKNINLFHVGLNTKKKFYFLSKNLSNKTPNLFNKIATLDNNYFTTNKLFMMLNFESIINLISKARLGSKFYKNYNKIKLSKYTKTRLIEIDNYELEESFIFSFLFYKAILLSNICYFSLNKYDIFKKLPIVSNKFCIISKKKFKHNLNYLHCLIKHSFVTIIKFSDNSMNYFICVI